MSLKFPFKFKHRLTNDVFFADVHEDCIVVSWVDDARYQHRINLSDVEHFIKNNNWLIIEEPSPIVEITQDEYNNLVEEINLLSELLAEANNRIAELETQSKDCTPKFKPVKDMTYEDWMIACTEGHVFKTRAGSNVSIIEMGDEGDNWPLRTYEGWHRVNGSFHPDTKVLEDIIERIS